MGGCRRFWVLPLLALVLLAGCAPAPAATPQGGGASGAGQTAAAPAQPQRTLVLASRVEPGAATPRVDQSSGINNCLYRHGYDRGGTRAGGLVGIFYDLQ